MVQVQELRSARAVTEFVAENKGRAVAILLKLNGCGACATFEPVWKRASLERGQGLGQGQGPLMASCQAPMAASILPPPGLKARFPSILLLGPGQEPEMIGIHGFIEKLNELERKAEACRPSIWRLMLAGRRERHPDSLPYCFFGPDGKEKEVTVETLLSRMASRRSFSPAALFDRARPRSLRPSHPLPS